MKMFLDTYSRIAVGGTPTAASGAPTTAWEFTLQNKSGYTSHEHSDLDTIQPGEKQTIKVKTVKGYPTLS